MTVSARPYLTAGVAALAAGMIAVPTSIAPPTSSPAVVHDARIALAAATRPVPAPVALPAAFVVVPGQRAAAPTAAVAVSPKVAATAAVAASPKVAATAVPAAPSALVAFPGVADAIINGYNAVLPYVNYGVDLAQYAVGWIPVAGIFAPQIGIFYYNLIQPIVTSAVYNTAYVIGGNIGFIQAVSNVINDSVNAGIGFVNAEINWALSFLPPLPPPLPLAATQTTPLKTALVAGEPVTESAAAEKPDTKVAGPVEATTKEAPVAEKAPKAADPASTETVKGEAAAVQEPVTTKPETEPETEPASTTKTATSSSSGGVAAQGEVRGGTTSAADPKPAETSKDGEPSGQKPDKPTDKPADKPAEKPAESGAGADGKAGAKDTHAGKGSTGTDGAKKDTPKKDAAKKG
jgi:hypothetical protein